jgi:voltage-gated potassium channel
MIFVPVASAAVVLVTLTLSLQCAGMAALIGSIRTSLGPDVHRLGPIRSALLMVRLMTAFIGLHVLEILLWTGFYRWLCFRLWESAFYFSAASYATVGYGDVVLPQMWRHHRRADVRVVGELPVRHHDQARRARGAGLRRPLQGYIDAR